MASHLASDSIGECGFGEMEVFQTPDTYVIRDGVHALSCSRLDGSLRAHFNEENFLEPGSSLSSWGAVCMGSIHGVIGKLRLHQDCDWYLFVVLAHTKVGCLPPPASRPVYCIDKVVALPLSPLPPSGITLNRCSHKHHSKAERRMSDPKSILPSWSSAKTYISSKAKRGVGGTASPRDQEKVEKKLLEEILKSFEAKNFYYTPGDDLTHHMEYYAKRFGSSETSHSTVEASKLPLNGIDQEFFWNYQMLKDLIDQQQEEEGAENGRNKMVPGPSSHWLVPVVQGFFSAIDIKINYEEVVAASPLIPDLLKESYLRDPVDVQVTLISRRSRHFAGTRYKRRGTNEEGSVANFVETEMFVTALGHTVSFVQVRGSIPLYWSQASTKYKPVPLLHQSEKENAAAFKHHFDSLLRRYHSNVVIVNLVDKSGRENIIGQQFSKHILNLNSPKLTYITFDFHEYCKGMKYDKVVHLIENMTQLFREVRYTWCDGGGLILAQRGVFRVNCMDCLDRTNLVQSAIGRVVFETQIHKLGLLLPEERVPDNIKSTFKQLWADNGDAISRQYAGTAALKGDYTRTGERKFTGMMKDGLNSAERYYLNRFKDALKQSAIDLMVLSGTTERIFEMKESGTREQQAAFFQVKKGFFDELVQQARRAVVPEEESYLNGWPLVSCATSWGNKLDDPDTLLLITTSNYYVVPYSDDDKGDQLTMYECIPIECITLFEIGPESSTFGSNFHCLRIHFFSDKEALFHTLRPPGGDVDQSAKSIVIEIFSCFAQARCTNSLGTPIVERKLDFLNSQPHKTLRYIGKYNKFASVFSKLRLGDSQRRSGFNRRVVHSSKNTLNFFSTKVGSIPLALKSQFNKKSNVGDQTSSFFLFPNPGVKGDTPTLTTYPKSDSVESFDNVSISDISAAITLGTTPSLYPYSNDLYLPNCGVILLGSTNIPPNFLDLFAPIPLHSTSQLFPHTFSPPAMSRTVSESSLLSGLCKTANSPRVEENHLDSHHSANFFPNSIKKGEDRSQTSSAEPLAVIEDHFSLKGRETIPNILISPDEGNLTEGDLATNKCHELIRRGTVGVEFWELGSKSTSQLNSSSPAVGLVKNTANRMLFYKGSSTSGGRAIPTHLDSGGLILDGSSHRQPTLEEELMAPTCKSRVIIL